MLEHNVTLGMFSFGGRYAGTYVRSEPVKNGVTSIINVAQGATFSTFSWQIMIHN